MNNIRNIKKSFKKTSLRIINPVYFIRLYSYRTALANMSMPCTWRSSGALEVWRLWIRLLLRQSFKHYNRQNLLVCAFRNRMYRLWVDTLKRRHINLWIMTQPNTRSHLSIQSFSHCDTDLKCKYISIIAVLRKTASIETQLQAPTNWLIVSYYN